MIGAGGARQGILSLAIKDKGSLHTAYMSFLRGGGLFVPTTKRYQIGDEVFLLLTLLDDNDRLPVAGKVVWMATPEWTVKGGVSRGFGASRWRSCSSSGRKLSRWPGSIRPASRSSRRASGRSPLCVT